MWYRAGNEIENCDYYNGLTIADYWHTPFTNREKMEPDQFALVAARSVSGTRVLLHGSKWVCEKALDNFTLALANNTQVLTQDMLTAGILFVRATE